LDQRERQQGATGKANVLHSLEGGGLVLNGALNGPPQIVVYHTVETPPD
jgi:hypothetical protein